MPARSILPQAYEMFCTHLACVRSRPPWGACPTPTLAIDYLGVHPQVLWSYTIRRQGPEVEKDARRLYRRVGRRNLYRYEAALKWLPGGADKAALALDPALGLRRARRARGRRPRGRARARRAPGARPD